MMTVLLIFAGSVGLVFGEKKCLMQYLKIWKAQGQMELYVIPIYSFTH